MRGNVRGHRSAMLQACSCESGAPSQEPIAIPARCERQAACSQAIHWSCCSPCRSRGGCWMRLCSDQSIGTWIRSFDCMRVRERAGLFGTLVCYCLLSCRHRTLALFYRHARHLIHLSYQRVSSQMVAPEFRLLGMTRNRPEGLQALNSGDAVEGSAYHRRSGKCNWARAPGHA